MVVKSDGWFNLKQVRCCLAQVFKVHGAQESFDLVDAEIGELEVQFLNGADELVQHAPGKCGVRWLRCCAQGGRALGGLGLRLRQRGRRRPGALSPATRWTSAHRRRVYHMPWYTHMPRPWKHTRRERVGRDTRDRHACARAHLFRHGQGSRMAASCCLLLAPMQSMRATFRCGRSGQCH